MSCLNPTLAWQDSKVVTKNGSHPVIFSFKQLDPCAYRWRYDDATGENKFVSSRYVPLELPCGKCLLCRKTRAYEITCRAYMELMAHPERPAAFITLTVDDVNLPRVFPGAILTHRPWQLFAKRFRKSVGSFRYLMCGEYGEKSKRPHYHAIIYGWCPLPSDKVWNKDDCSYCDSKILQDAWPFGHVMARRVNFNTLAYVAGYQLKLDGVEIPGDLEEGQIDRNYVKWSRNPGLGYDFLLRYPNMIRNLKQRCFDGFEYEQRSFTLVNGYRSGIIPFHSRFLLKVLKDMADGKKSAPLQLRNEFDIIRVSKERGVLLRHLHNPPMAESVRMTNLMNRAKTLEFQLAGKSRDLDA